MKSGIVYLVGAGPGDNGLISDKALQLLNKADCVVYDYLSSHSFVEKLSCEKIYVGKKGSDHTLPQEKINELIVRKAKEGKKVVRLKGGDPFIFGRGGEEAEELVKAGVKFSIVPGISSFYSAPAYAGIPLTHRDFANSFEVITGHRREDSSDEEINLPEYNEHKTFVFLMGMKNLGFIAKSLVTEKNFPEDMPVGIVSWGTTPEQMVVTGTLKNIEKKADERGIQSPAIIIIGRVVSLREKLRWFDNLPLFGKKIVVTRTRQQASALSSALYSLGAKTVELPTIEIKRKDDLTDLIDAVRNIEKYSWIIFTSQNAVNIFFDVLKENDKDARCMHSLKIAAIGPATAKELEHYFIKPDLIPSKYVAEEIVAEMSKEDINGKSILLPCAAEARQTLKEGLLELGAEVDRIHIYDTVVPENMSEELLAEVSSADMITFTSSSAVKNFSKIANKTDTRIACIGPITADTASGLGYNPDIVASEYTIDGLVQAITEYYTGG
ncbi:MAG: uroporphyrinogen-III C-methyltransferase [Spirochaetes bacterium]|nr:uroporphyrinogen-III C-methyltransferase [Spirochaetota bacterium]